jgi:hypothetical protein
LTDEIKRERPKGRPSKEAEKADKCLAIVNTCKVCKSPFRDEITAEMLRGEQFHVEIMKQYNEAPYFKENPLSPANMSHHWKHSNPETMAKIDHESVMGREIVKSEYSPEVMNLYQSRYDSTLNKLKMMDDIHKQRLHNLWEMQRNLEDLKDKVHKEIEEGIEPGPIEIMRVQELTFAVDDALNALTDSVVKHLKSEQGPAKNINFIFVREVKTGIEKFITTFMDVIVEEIDDEMLRDRLKEKFIEKLDSSVSPIIDRVQIAEAEVIE